MRVDYEYVNASELYETAKENDCNGLMLITQRRRRKSVTTAVLTIKRWLAGDVVIFLRNDGNYRQFYHYFDSAFHFHPSLKKQISDVLGVDEWTYGRGEKMNRALVFKHHDGKKKVETLIGYFEDPLKPDEIKSAYDVNVDNYFLVWEEFIKFNIDMKPIQEIERDLLNFKEFIISFTDSTLQIPEGKFFICMLANPVTSVVAYEKAFKLERPSEDDNVKIGEGSPLKLLYTIPNLSTEQIIEDDDGENERYQAYLKGQIFMKFANVEQDIKLYTTYYVGEMGNFVLLQMDTIHEYIIDYKSNLENYGRFIDRQYNKKEGYGIIYNILKHGRPNSIVGRVVFTSDKVMTEYEKTYKSIRRELFNR